MQARALPLVRSTAVRIYMNMLNQRPGEYGARRGAGPDVPFQQDDSQNSSWRCDPTSMGRRARQRQGAAAGTRTRGSRRCHGAAVTDSISNRSRIRPTEHGRRTGPREQQVGQCASRRHQHELNMNVVGRQAAAALISLSRFEPRGLSLTFVWNPDAMADAVAHVVAWHVACGGTLGMRCQVWFLSPPTERVIHAFVLSALCASRSTMLCVPRLPLQLDRCVRGV